MLKEKRRERLVVVLGLGFKVRVVLDGEFRSHADFRRQRHPSAPVVLLNVSAIGPPCGPRHSAMVSTRIISPLYDPL
jgi:hypothetical protein